MKKLLFRLKNYLNQLLIYELNKRRIHKWSANNKGRS